MMKLYRSGFIHCLVGGSALAALIEVREGFHAQAPEIFYPCHTVFLFALVVWLLVYASKKLIPLGRFVRDLVLIVCCYGMAATGSFVAVFAIPAVSVLAIVMLKRGAGFGLNAREA